jgi:outer membrane protein assembly factor BamB
MVDPLDQWPAWRGPLSTGEAPRAQPPTTWSETDNLRWKTRLPGRGHGSPIVWGNRIYLTTAVPLGEELPPRSTKSPGSHDNTPATHRQRYLALAIDRDSGQILWQTTLREAFPHDGGGHYTGSLASASPVTDGRRLYVSFGSEGIYALEPDGSLAWERDLGKMYPVHGHGEGSSPALWRDLLFVNWDHERDSSLVALDTATGEERWRVPRDEITSWGSPIVIEHQGEPQLVVSGTRRIRAYAPATGEVLWECGGLSTNVVASPVAGGGFLFAGSSYDTKAFLAIRLEGARGDLTGTDHVAWSRNRATPYVPSPLLAGGTLFFLHHYQGVLIGVDPRTGEDRPGAFRLPGIADVYASPVAAEGKLYITDRDGTTVVYQQGARPKFLAENRLDDQFSASAAIAGQQFFLRGERWLYCLGDN